MYNVLKMGISLKALACLPIYYGFAQYLPDSYSAFGGRIWNALRVFLCKQIFKKAGKISTINRRVNFGSGKNIEIGDCSGIGANVTMPSDTIIGNYVMVGRQTFILNRNHEFSRTDIPINQQGNRLSQQTVIEDDCWIGLRTIMTPGRHIRKGTIVAMGCTLCKDFPEYSIVGGNPSKFIKSRI